MAKFNTDYVQIGTHNDWNLFYRPQSDDFLAMKGRKQRHGDRRSYLIDAIDDEDAKELRKKHRKEPCTFRWWDPHDEIDRMVTITSYSNKGVAVKIGDDEGTRFLKTDSYRSNSIDGIGVVTGDVKRLLAATEMLRRAKAELAAAHKAAVTVVKIQAPGYHGRAADYHAEEDRLRSEINKVAAKAKEAE